MQTSNAVPSLPYLEKAAAHLRASGLAVEIAIDADTGEMRLIAEGHPVPVREFPSNVGDVGETDISDLYH
jgi:hypothetical protein